jgi:hypothetical protein
MGAVLGPFFLHGAGLDTLMRATSACLAAVTATGSAAAVRLLPRKGGRATAILATLLAWTALLCCGEYLILPVVTALLACRVKPVAQIEPAAPAELRRPPADLVGVPSPPAPPSGPPPGFHPGSTPGPKCRPRPET